MFTFQFVCLGIFYHVDIEYPNFPSYLEPYKDKGVIYIFQIKDGSYSKWWTIDF